MIESPFARLHQEFMRPLFQRVLSVLGQKGLLGKFRRVIVDGAVIDIQVTSQLAQAENLKALNNYVQLLELSQTLLGEEVTRLGIKVEDGPAFMAEKLGVDSSLVRGLEERQVIQAQQQAQLAAQQQAELAAPAEEQRPVAVAA